MENKFRFLAAALLLFFLAGCTQYFTIFGKRSKFFTEQEKTVLDKSLKAIDFDRGYDPRADLDHIYSYTFKDEDKKKISAKFSDSLKDTSSAEVVSLYEKVYRLKSLTMGRMKVYEYRGDWINHSYLKKYLSPGLEMYLALIEEEAIRRDGSYINIIDKRKREIEEETADQLKREQNERDRNFD